MICPNKNSSEWKALVAKVGETKALQMWQFLGDKKTTPPDLEIRDELYRQVSQDPEYFLKAYKGYLAPLVGNNPSVASMVDAFYLRLAGRNGKLEGDMLVTNSGNYSLFPTASHEYNAATNIPTEMESMLNKLQTKFKVPFRVINDPSLKWKGKYVNDGNRKLVLVNLAYATPDTPLHEYYHPFVRILSSRNPALFNSILDEARLSGDTRPDEEEVVTNYLAKAATARVKPSLLESFINFLKRLFGNKTVTESSTLKQILDTLDKGVDVSSESTLLEAYDKIEDLKKDVARKLNTKHSEHPRILDRLTKEAVKYTTSDSSNFYQDETGKDAAIRLTAFIGDRELGEFSNYGKNFKWTESEAVARKIWAQLSKTPLDDKIPSSSIEGTVTVESRLLTFPQLHESLKQELEKARIKGKMVHAFLQFAFEEDITKKEQARLQAIEYAKQYGVPFTRIEDHPDLSKIWNNIEDIAYEVNLAVNIGDKRKYSAKLKDRISPELTITSELLTDSNGNKIGTTIDGLVEHFNGDLSIIDWKTGDITKYRNSPYLIKYGDKFGLSDSKLTRGYLELAFRAVILKEKFPEATFREIKIVKINSRGEAKNMRLELSPYLATIGEYYKQTNPALYEQLSAKGLFNAEKYQGVAQPLLNVVDQIQHLPQEERLTYLKNKLASLHHGKSKQEIERDPGIKELSKQYTEAILELEKVAGVNLDEVTSDIPYIIGRFKNLSDISNPKVQTFHRMLLKAKNNVAQERKAFEDKHDDLYRKLVEEQKARSSRAADFVLGVGVVGSVLTASLPGFAIALLARSAVKRLINVNTKDYWAFMWRKGTDGYYLNSTDTYMYKGQERRMSPAQKAYRDYVKSSMQEMYNSFAQEIVGDDRYGRPVTRASLLKLPPVMPDNFMPRIPKEFDEIREEESFLQGAAGVGSAVKYQTRKYLTSFIEESFDNPTMPIPFRFFQHEGSSVVQDELHSFDVEAAYKAFMTNMIYKKHMDSMYDVAVGTAQTLYDELDEDGNARYPELSKFVSEVIYPQILGTSKAVELQSKKWQFKAGKMMAKFTGLKEGTPVVVSQERVIRMFKSSVTMMAMGFRVIGPIRNFALYAVQNVSMSTRKAIGKLVGVPPEDFDGVHVSGATEVMRDYLKNKMFGKEEESKLWNLARKFNWLPDDFAYNVSTDHLLSKPMQISPTNSAYMFYQVGETVGSMWHLAGLMKGIKVTNAEGKKVSLWDAYDNKGNWTLGTRGVVEQADGTMKELKELDELEIKNLKRANERLNGSYRQEEKTAIENTIFGELVLQFKKYFYQFLKVNFASQYKDITTGRYVLDDKAPDGMPKYKWISEALEGRMWVLAKSIWLLSTLNFSKLKGYLGDTTVSSTSVARNPRKKALVEAINTGVWMLLLWAAFSAYFDDDDEDKTVARQARQLIFDTSRGLHPKDIFDTADKPIVAAQRLSDLGNAAVSFLFEGMWSDKENKSGYPVGGKTLLRALPFGGAYIQLQDMYKDYDIESDPLLNMR